MSTYEYDEILGILASTVEEVFFSSLKGVTQNLIKINTRTKGNSVVN